MNRLALKTALTAEAAQITSYLMNAEGTCTCGRVMRKLDSKLVMMTAVPSQGQLLAAAYCLNCSRVINRTLKSLRNVMYSGTETAPIEPIK